MDEFYRQGDEEKRLGIDVSPLCDRNVSTVGNTQVNVDYCCLDLAPWNLGKAALLYSLFIQFAWIGGAGNKRL